MWAIAEYLVCIKESNPVVYNTVHQTLLATQNFVNLRHFPRKISIVRFQFIVNKVTRFLVSIPWIVIGRQSSGGSAMCNLHSTSSKRCKAEINAEAVHHWFKSEMSHFLHSHIIFAFFTSIIISSTPDT